MLKRTKPKSMPVLAMISRKMEKVQWTCSNFLNRKTHGWSRRQQKCFLFAICFVMGGISTLSLGIHTNSHSRTVKDITTTKPQIGPPLNPNNVTGSLYPTDTLIFYRFRKALDSLQQTPQGRQAYENFLRQRPGFIDSLANAERLFKETFKY